MLSFWFTEEFNYQQTSGFGVEAVSSGFLDIKPVDASSEPLSIPFVWWFFSFFNPSFRWWDEYPGLPANPNVVDEGIDSLRFIRFESDANPDEFYYLVVPGEKDGVAIEPFIHLDGNVVALPGENPTEVDISILSSLVSDSFDVVDVREVPVDVPDLLAFQEETSVASVPEMSSIASMAILGAAFLMAAIRRSFFARNQKGKFCS